MKLNFHQLQLGNGPEPRADSKLEPLTDSTFLLFGGLNHEAVFNDLWKGSLVGASLNWQRLPIQSMPQLISFSCCSAGSILYLFGGQKMVTNPTQVQTITVGQLYRIDSQNGVCIKLEQKGDLPGARNSAGIVFWKDTNSLLLMGGTDQFMRTFPGLWQFHLESGEWTCHQVQGLDVYKAGLWSHSLHLSELQITFEAKKGFQPQLVEVLVRDVVKQLSRPCKGPFLTIIGGCSQPTSVYPVLTQVSLQDWSIATVLRVAPSCAHRCIEIKAGLFLRIGGMDGQHCLSIALISANGMLQLGGKQAIGMGAVMLTEQNKDILLCFGGADESGFMGASGYTLI